MRSGSVCSLNCVARVLNKIMALYLSDFINFFFLFFFSFFFDPACMLYRKVTKLWVARNLSCNLPKIQEKRESLRVFCPILAN